MSKFKPTFSGTVKNGKIEVDDKDAFKIWIGSLDGKKVEIILNNLTDKRTLSQNNALHLYCKQVSERLNESGLNIEKVIKNFTMEHEWSPALVKELLWREAQRFITEKESTTELNKLQEIDKIWEIMNRFLAKLRVESIPFPSLNIDKTDD